MAHCRGGASRSWRCLVARGWPVFTTAASSTTLHIRFAQEIKILNDTTMCQEDASIALSSPGSFQTRRVDYVPFRTLAFRFRVTLETPGFISSNHIREKFRNSLMLFKFPSDSRFLHHFHIVSSMAKYLRSWFEQSRMKGLTPQELFHFHHTL